MDPPVSLKWAGSFCFKPTHKLKYRCMRKQHFAWTFLVCALVATIYGGYSVISHLSSGTKLSVWGLVLFIAGLVMLVIFSSLLIVDRIKKSKAPKQEQEVVEQKQEEPAPTVEEPKKDSAQDVPDTREEKPAPVEKERSARVQRDYEYVSASRPSRSRYDSDGGTAYVKKVGYGPVLRVSGNRFLDMRSNTYYHIQGHVIYQDGSGPVFEIYGRQIKSAFGGYLYEISGSNINKVYGGYFASISGNYITVYDLSDKYEVTSSLSLEQYLVVAALLFGRY